MRLLVGLSTVVVGLTIHFAYSVSNIKLINITMRHSYNTCNFSSGSKFSEYLIWFIDTPFNVDDGFDVVFHRKIPHHQLCDSL